MAFFDLPLAKLQSFQLPDYEPKDFDAFWAGTLKEAAAFPLEAEFQRVDEPAYRAVDVYDVTFNGFGGHPIKGWFVEPAGNTRKLPCWVSFIGYSGGRSFPTDHLLPLAAGHAHLVMDSRGQGWNSPGATPDPVGSAPASPGVMTRGIESPQTYYYRRIFTDAARAVEAAVSHPHVDAARIAVSGGSQGGGITIAAAALSGRKVKLAMPDVPFLCGYRRAVELVDTAPYSEITAYCKCHRDKAAGVFQTLAYFDGVNFAPRISARCLFSAGLMDNICPPSTVFAAYNRVKSDKEIRVYEFNNHEGGGPFQALEKLRFAAKYL